MHDGSNRSRLVQLIACALLLVGCRPDGGGAIAPIRAESGGTVVSDDGRVTLSIPPAALTEDTVIIIQRSGEPTTAGPPYDVTPKGLHFLEPAALTETFTEQEVTALREASGGGYPLLVATLSSADGGREIPADSMVSYDRASPIVGTTAQITASIEYLAKLQSARAESSLASRAAEVVVQLQPPAEIPVGGVDRVVASIDEIFPDGAAWIGELVVNAPKRDCPLLAFPEHKVAHLLQVIVPSARTAGAASTAAPNVSLIKCLKPGWGAVKARGNISVSFTAESGDSNDPWQTVDTVESYIEVKDYAECVAAPRRSVPPGGACAIDEDCAESATCVDDRYLMGGICALTCTRNGDCEDFGSKCVSPLEYLYIEGIYGEAAKELTSPTCMPSCSHSSECRSGYRCGQTSVGSVCLPGDPREGNDADNRPTEIRLARVDGEPWGTIGGRLESATDVDVYAIDIAGPGDYRIHTYGVGDRQLLVFPVTVEADGVITRGEALSPVATGYALDQPGRYHIVVSDPSDRSRSGHYGIEITRSGYCGDGFAEGYED